MENEFIIEISNLSRLNKTCVTAVPIHKAWTFMVSISLLPEFSDHNIDHLILQTLSSVGMCKSGGSSHQSKAGE